jgi:hypothetical protein
MSAEIVWDGRPEDVFLAGYAVYVDRINAALLALAQSYAARIEAWMKQNASWTDRTGNARQGLRAEVEEMVNQIAINMMHGVPYGVWLEIRNQGVYAILLPALDKFAAELWDDIERLFA